ncbi:MAG: protein kinase [Myxococcota bacterium]
MKPVVFGRYTLIERLGSGGMAEVFLAKTRGDKGLERLVAIKRIHGHLAADPKFTSMFIDEANLAAKLTHANIAQIFDLGRVDNQYFIAMEYIHGRDLRAIFRYFLRHKQTVPVPQACYMGLKMCEGLDYAHNRKDYTGRDLNLVHRDISLNNLILSFDGELKIIDFGVAKAIGRSVRTETGFVKGKIAYMSPEQLMRQPFDKRSDVFACGIIMFEILTGKRLFAEPNLRALIHKVRNAEVPPPRTLNPDIPSELEAIILKALEKEVARRYQSAGELHDDLLEFVQGHGLYITRSAVARWMQDLYKEHYVAESARIAALWERSKEMEADLPLPEGFARYDDTGPVAAPLPPAARAVALDDRDAMITQVNTVPDTPKPPVENPTKLGWEPAESSQPVVSPGDLVQAGLEAETDIFKPTVPPPARAADGEPGRRLPLPPSPDQSAEQSMAGQTVPDQPASTISATDTMVHDRNWTPLIAMAIVALIVLAIVALVSLA